MCTVVKIKTYTDDRINVARSVSAVTVAGGKGQYVAWSVSAVMIMAWSVEGLMIG